MFPCFPCFLSQVEDYTNSLRMSNIIKKFQHSCDEMSEDTELVTNMDIETQFKEFIHANPELKEVNCISIKTGFVSELLSKINIEEMKEITAAAKDTVVFVPEDGGVFLSENVFSKLSVLNSFGYCKNCRPFWIDEIRWGKNGDKTILMCVVDCSKI